MTFIDTLPAAGIPCRPVMTLMTIFSSAFLHHFSYGVQLSPLIHKLAEATDSCHCLCNFFPPQGLFLSQAEMDVFLHSVTLKAFFWGMCPIWTQQRMCLTSLVARQHCFWLQERLTSEQLRNFTLNTGAFGSGWRGSSLTRYSEMDRTDSGYVLGVANSYIFTFHWC